MVSIEEVRETLNQASVEEPLNTDPTIEVEVVNSASSDSRKDFSRRSGLVFHNGSTHCGRLLENTTVAE